MHNPANKQKTNKQMLLKT